MRAVERTYVRTESGVVKVGAGETVPDNALPEHVAKLAAHGMLNDASNSAGPAPKGGVTKPAGAATVSTPAEGGGGGDKGA